MMEHFNVYMFWNITKLHVKATRCITKFICIIIEEGKNVSNEKAKAIIQHADKFWL